MLSAFTEPALAFHDGWSEPSFARNRFQKLPRFHSSRSSDSGPQSSFLGHGQVFDRTIAAALNTPSECNGMPPLRCDGALTPLGSRSEMRALGECATRSQRVNHHARE
jgi:hypothetical protein